MSERSLSELSLLDDSRSLSPKSMRSLESDETPAAAAVGGCKSKRSAETVELLHVRLSRSRSASSKEYRAQGRSAPDFWATLLKGMGEEGGSAWCSTVSKPPLGETTEALERPFRDVPTMSTLPGLRAVGAKPGRGVVQSKSSGNLTTQSFASMRRAGTLREESRPSWLRAVVIQLSDVWGVSFTAFLTRAFRTGKEARPRNQGSIAEMAASTVRCGTTRTLAACGPVAFGGSLCRAFSYLKKREGWNGPCA